MAKTQHTCNEGAGPYFGRLSDDGCPRCEELKAGAEPRRWANMTGYQRPLNDVQREEKARQRVATLQAAHRRDQPW